MNIYMWSGPRNLSTALMRSFENRNDTIVWDEPLYAYYLKKTKKKHPLANDIIEKYETNINNLILNMTKDVKRKYLYQKHMTHHILSETPLEWIKNGINCFLIRNPKEVIQSYIKKNILTNSNDIGFPMQIKLLNLVKELGVKPIVINADDLTSNPKRVLEILCKKLHIDFTKRMLNWPSGRRNTDGIWGKVWYKNVESSTSFKNLNKNHDDIPIKYNNIYLECLEIYKNINNHNILYEQ